MWNPKCAENDASCFMSTWGTMMADGMWMSQSYRQNPSSAVSQAPANCHFYNFVFESFFWNEKVDHQIMAMNSTDPSNWTVNAGMMSSDLMMMNGTACMWMPQTEWSGVDQYLCKMTYASIHIYLVVWGHWMNGMWMWDTTHSTAAWWPHNMMNTREETEQANWIGKNTTWPEMVGSNWGSCDSNMNVTSLSSNVTMTMSANLTLWLPKVWLSHVVIKQWSHMGMNGSHMVWPAKSNMSLFDTWSSTGCWWMGMTWGDMLPDMNYCAHGCEVSYVLMDMHSSIHVMETKGVWTTASMIVGNGNTTVGTGSGVGNGSTWTGTVGTGNGGTSVTVSSALTMALNMLFLVLPIVVIN